MAVTTDAGPSTGPSTGIACISADSHVTEPPDTYTARIDKKYLDRAPVLKQLDRLGATMVIDGGVGHVPYPMIAAAGLKPEEINLYSGRTFEELHRGGWDPVARLGDQDLDGIVAEVIYPSVGMLLCNHPDFDYKFACNQAYNEWLAEFCSGAPDRLLGVGQVTMRTPEDAIAELASIRDLGLRGVMLPGVPNGPDYHEPHWDPFWEAAEDVGLPVSFHILTGGTAQMGSAAIRGPKMNGFLTIIRGVQDVIGALIYGAVFERHPRLKVVCVEADAGWVPHYLYRMDHAFKRHRNWLEAGALTRLPSEYFRDHVYVTFQDDWVAFKVVDLLNVERLMWANDFPHSDATWPWSQEILVEQTAHLTDHQKHRILRDNCAELYGVQTDG